MKDAILTHNHPGGWAYDENDIRRIGNSFSLADFVLAIKGDLKEMRAVTPNYTFSIKRPEKGWEISAYKLEKIYEQENNKLKIEFSKRISDGELTSVRAITTHYHILNKKLSKLFNWEYEKLKTI